MLRLPAAWWESLLSTVFPATRTGVVSLPAERASLAASLALREDRPRGPLFSPIPRDTFSLSAILPIARGGSVRARTNETPTLAQGSGVFSRERAD